MVYSSCSIHRGTACQIHCPPPGHHRSCNEIVCQLHSTSSIALSSQRLLPGTTTASTGQAPHLISASGNTRNIQRLAPFTNQHTLIQLRHGNYECLPATLYTTILASMFAACSSRMENGSTGRGHNSHRLKGPKSAATTAARCSPPLQYKEDGWSV